jgi:hypothetical protein
MPLFGSKNAQPAQTVTTTTTHHPQQKSGLFGHRKSAVQPGTTPSTTSNGGGLLNRHSQVDPVQNGNGHHNGHHSLLSRNHEDASIVGARQRVMQAEQAEKDADKALIAARQAVRSAREHVKHLEHEAKEEVCLLSEADSKSNMY